MAEVRAADDLGAGPADGLLRQLVLQVEHVGLDEPRTVPLDGAVGPEVVLRELLVGAEAQVDDVALAQLEVHDRRAQERPLVDLLVEVHVEVALEVHLAALGVEIADEGQLVIVAEVAGGEV